MSIVGRAIREARAFTLFRLTQDFFGDWGTGTTSYSGVTVTQQSAMTCSAVYAAVAFISETIATLPWDAIERYPDGTRYQRALPAWMAKPNRATGLEWPDYVQQTLTSLLLDGNAFTGVVRRPGALEPFELWPLDPTAVDVAMENGRAEYSLRTERGSIVRLPRENLVHIRGLSMPGQVRGISPVEQARQSLGRTLAAEKYASKMFANMATPGAVIVAGKQVTNQEAKELAERYDSVHRGADNAFKTTVFGQGTEIKTPQMTPEQVQMIETMKYGILDVARWYRIMPYLLDPTVTSTWGSGIAEQNIQTKQYTLNPWAVRIQRGLAPLMYDTYLTPAYQMRCDFRGFLKGDPEKQARYLETKIRCQALTPNEWRALDDENPLPGGDNTLTSVQFAPKGAPNA